VNEPAPQAPVARTRKEAPVVATTSRHQILLGASAPQQAKDKAVAPQLPVIDDDHDDDNNGDDVDGFLNTGALDGSYMPPLDDEHFRGPRIMPIRPTSCSQRLNFHGLSQDTPPEAGDQAEQANIFSPGTLHKSIQDVQSPEVKKKHRKRSKPGASASQPAPRTVRDEQMVPPRRDGLTRMHEAGKPILPPKLLRIAQGSMKALHDAILMLEGILLNDEDPNYPVFTCKVPKGVNFVDEAPADVFFIAFEDVFKLFHSRRLDYNLVRLYALNLAVKIKRETNPYVAIADPYYMRDSQLVEGSGRRIMAREYLQSFMLKNMSKNSHLVPFFCK
jgi:hypothetical protein